MSLIFRLVTAAHARGTHHRLALDGLRKLGGGEPEKWQRLFLKHVDKLVLGAKAPDDEFKDFVNHVLHPRDNFWGGAPDKARSWYGDLVECLARSDWEAAAWCAGVLSHYVTDPVCPFHTAQSEAENAIHRAFEWSVSRSYAALIAGASQKSPRSLNITEEPNWLEQLIAEAAVEANQHYEKLIAHYDIHRGVVDPPSGLDAVAQRILGELLDLAATIFAAILARAIAESKAQAPDVSLTADMILATLRIPYNSFLKRIENNQDRAEVEAIYDELVATGKVELNLSEDDRVVRARYATEVLAKKSAVDMAARFPAKGRKPETTDAEHAAKLKRVGARGLPTTGVTRAPAIPTTNREKELPLDEPARPAPKAADQTKPASPVGRFKGQPVDVDVAPTAAVAVPADGVTAAVAAVPPEAAEGQAPIEAIPPVAPRSLMAAVAELSQPEQAIELAKAPEPLVRSERAGQPARIYLTAAQDVVDAPSIGPKMADRLRPIGLRSVGDLLLADPKKVAAQLGHGDVDADTVRDWQDQARLVCLIPGLRGTHAQLLVGADFRTAASIAACEADELCARVLTFASSPAGQRVLRNADAPDIEKIKLWLDGARQAQAA